ncbi:MAG: potassium transporter [Holophagae bacterium]|nr:MAG: potassium transporter [Holophagae bacterium]
MHGEGFFYQAFVYLLAAVVSVPIAKRLGLGSVLGYLLAGIAIGPWGLRLVGEEGADVLHFAEFGVVMMLFLIGLELQPSLLWRLRVPIVGLGGLQVGVTALTLTAVAVALGLPWNAGLAVGLILALSSTAIVLQTLEEKGLLKTDAGQSAFSVLLFQDIAVIPMLAVLPLLAVGETRATASGGTSWIDGLPPVAKTLVVLAAVVAIVVGGRYLTRPAFRFIARARLRELFTAAALLLVIAIALLMSRVGLSPALGTFLAGVVLANSEYRHELEGDIEPFKGLLLGLFFIAVGASVDFGLVASRPAVVAGLVAALLATKFGVLLVLGRAFGMGTDQNLLFSFALAQGGEFAFVLFSFASQHGVLPVSVTGPLVAVVALSMALTPLVMLVHERLVAPRIGRREGEAREPDAITGSSQVIIAGYGRVGSVIGRLLAANGISATVLDHDSDHVELLRRFGQRVFYGDASRHDLLEAAGAGSARVLVIAIDDPDKILQIVETAHRYYPHLQVLARAVSRTHAYELLDAGVELVYRENLDTSLQMGVDVMRAMGVRAYEAGRRSRLFRRHDELGLRELAAMREDRPAYIRRARQQLEELERILTADRLEADEQRDAAWDTRTLREEMAGGAER